jgi:hypothetical protein
MYLRSNRLIHNLKVIATMDPNSSNVLRYIQEQLQLMRTEMRNMSNQMNKGDIQKTKIVKNKTEIFSIQFYFIFFFLLFLLSFRWKGSWDLGFSVQIIWILIFHLPKVTGICYKGRHIVNPGGRRRAICRIRRQKKALLGNRQGVRTYPSRLL